MREDNPATEIANALSECISACVLLCQRRPKAQRGEILDALSWFVEAAPLYDLPTVQGDMSKDMFHAGAAAAVRVKDAVLAWDGIIDPPPCLASLAREFLVAIGLERVLEPPPEPNA